MHYIESREIHLPLAVCNLVLAYAHKWKHQQDSHGTKADTHTRAAFCSEFIQALYLLLTPADDYVKLTDPPHSTEVHEFVVQIRPQASLEVQIAALFHDFERYSYELRVPRFMNATLDEEIRKQVVHPINAARVARHLLKELNLLTPSELEHVCFFIRHHDQKDIREPIHLAGEVVLDAVKGHPLVPELETLQCADAAAFFKTTLEPFIVEMLHVRKEDIAKVQKRVTTNFHRIPDESTKLLVRSELQRKWSPDTIVGQCVMPIIMHHN